MQHTYILVPGGALVSALVSQSVGSWLEYSCDGQGYELFGELAL